MVNGTTVVFQLQQEEEQKIRDRAANAAALAAIGSGTKRKRLSAAGLPEGTAGVSAEDVPVHVYAHILWDHLKTAAPF